MRSKLQMLRMILIIVLCLLRPELDVQSNLVTLIHNTAIAGRHLAGVEVDNTGDGGSAVRVPHTKDLKIDVRNTGRG